MAKRFEEELTAEDPPRIEVESRFEVWEAQKENVQPLPQGRKIEVLMSALKIVTDNSTRKQMIEDRGKQFESDLQEVDHDYDKKLDLWVKHIEWLEQHVPDGGKVNGITNAIEQCIEIYYNRKEFKQDERLFDIFMKFKRFCDEPVEVFGFMYANSIGTLLARFYLNWSWQYEMKKNLSRAESLLKLGIKNLATPRSVLEEACVQLKHRIQRLIQSGDLEPHQEATSLNIREMQAQLANEGIRAALQTLKFKVSKSKGSSVAVERIGQSIDSNNIGGLKNQTKMVNGLRVPKKVDLPKKANKPVQVFADTENEDPENPDFRDTIKKIPTSQKVQTIGRGGRENLVPKAGVLGRSSRTVLRH